MIRLLIHPDSDGKFTLLMPLNLGEGFGSMETVIDFDESTIPPPFQQSVLDELVKPRDERGPGFPGQSWRGLTPAGVAEAATARMKQRRGQNPPPEHAHYFYDEVGDIAVDGKGVLELEARFGDAPSTINDLHGPVTAAEALAMRVSPPTGGP